MGLTEEALTLPLSLTKGEATQTRGTFHCPNAGWGVHRTRKVRDCIASPDRLEKLASASGVRDKFTIEALANQLQLLGATL